MSAKPQIPGGPIGVWLILGVIMLGSGAIFLETAGQAKERYQATHGTGGTPGVVTITEWKVAHKKSHCEGRFRPDKGAPMPDVVRINGPGRDECKRGKKVQARLLKGDGGGWINTNDQDEAFTDEAGGWTYAIIPALFGVLTLIVGLPWALLTLAAPLALLNRGDRQDPEPRA